MKTDYREQKAIEKQIKEKSYEIAKLKHQGEQTSILMYWGKKNDER